jgi:hypothetical protein
MKRSSVFLAVLVAGSLAAKAEPTYVGTIQTPAPGGFLAAIFMIAGIAFLLCLIPTLLAFKRRHRDRKAILVLSVFFGWLPFAWVIGLIWALTGNVEPLRANA